MKYESVTIDGLDAIADELLGYIAPKERAVVVALSGELGAGKTTFVQIMARKLGIEESITSPTYVIEKVYELETGEFKRLVHIDVYRLESEKELISLGFEALLEDSTTLIFLEWPERVEGILPSGIVVVRFEHKGEDVRDVIIEGI